MPRQMQKAYRGLFIIDLIPSPFRPDFGGDELERRIVGSVVRPAVTLGLEPVVLAPLPQQLSRKLIQERFKTSGLALTHPLRLTRATYRSNLSATLKNLLDKSSTPPERCLYLKLDGQSEQALPSLRAAAAMGIYAAYFMGVNNATNNLHGERFLETHQGFNVFLENRPLLEMASDYVSRFETADRPQQSYNVPYNTKKLA